MSVNYLLAKVLYVLNHDSYSILSIREMPVQNVRWNIFWQYVTSQKVDRPQGQSDFLGDLLLPHLTFFY